MVVATRSGRVEYDGGMEEIRAGITWVARGHEILRKAPHLFGLTAVASTTRERVPRLSDDIELRTSSRSPIAVVLDESARTRIVNEVLEWASDHPGEGRESGGYLFGRRLRSRSIALDPQEPDLLEVTFAAYPGEGTQRSSHEMRHDSDHALSLARTFGRQGRRERLVGDYHSHPDGDGVPSGGDLRGWLRSFQLLGVQDRYSPHWLLGDEVTPNCYLGVIVTRSGFGGWTWPQFHVWITREEDGRVVCEPVAV